MGTSSRKRNDKKKDFQKPKLKVGKGRQKATNATNTSFKSRGIILKEQSLHTHVPSLSSQFTHHISLLASRSDAQRRDSLSFLSSVMSNRPVGSASPVPSGVLLSTVLPLVLDGSDNVRALVVKLLRTFQLAELDGSEGKILLYARAGMTHLAAGIRDSTMDVLSWALASTGSRLMSCPGGWIKTLKHFALLLGWPVGESKLVIGQQAKMHYLGETKSLIKTLNNLNEYLSRGLAADDRIETVLQHNMFPLTMDHNYGLPQNSSPYVSLDLFTTQRNEDSDVYVEPEDRRQAFYIHFLRSFDRGFKELKKRGGETGRVAASGERVIADAIAGFEPLGIVAGARS